MELQNSSQCIAHISGFYKNLSYDLRMEMPGEKGFSERNLRNMYDFYHTYNQYLEILQQAAANSVVSNHQHRVDDFMLEIFSIPWDYQCKIVAKCKNNPGKALFFVRKVIQNSWGRNVLLNFLDTDLYER